MKNILRVLPFFLGGLLLSSKGYSQRSFDSKKMDSLFEQGLSHTKMMGSICIRKNGSTVYSKAFGYSSSLNGNTRIANSYTKYRIGSISKMFTATMIFQLIQQNRLRLDSKLSSYFPRIPNAKRISILSMLNHHSGIHNFTDDSTYTDWNTKPRTQQQMLAMLEKQPSDFEPTERGEYSNTNYLLLGYIIEKVTGQKYAEALQQMIITKAGLKNTCYGGKINPARNEARSYTYKSKGWEAETETDMSIPGGAGAIVSSPEDLDKFIEALFGGRLISMSMLDKMKVMDDDFGRGMQKMPFHNKTSYGHSGEIDGFQSTLSYFSRDSVSVAFCFNGMNYSMNSLMIGALSIYFNVPYKVPSFETLAISAANLKKHEGTYASAQLPLKIILKEEGGELTAQATGQSAFPLEAVSDKEFRYNEAGIVLLFEDSSNSMVLKQGGGSYSFTREAEEKN